MMTAEQKAEIITLRSGGITFSDIAEQLGLSINTVKSFYRRCGNAPEKAAASCCKCCGKAIVQPSGAREKKFCSDKCRMEWWNAHREDVNKKAFYDYVCECCGRHFRAYGSKRRKYCSHKCYIADNGISGTGIARRNEFKRMIEAADNGEIDIILTKSIQRFARNTVDLLETMRHLKDIGVEVRFE